MHQLTKHFMHYICLLLLLLPTVAFAQMPDSVSRLSQKEIQFPVDRSEGQDFQLLLLGENGLLMYHIKDKSFEDSNREIELVRLDTALNELWRETLVVDRQLDFSEAKADGKYAYFLFDRKANDVDIVRVDLEKRTSQTLQYEVLKSFQLSYTEAADSVLYLGGRIKDFPVVLRLNFDYNETAVLPSMNQRNASLVAMHIDRPKKRLVVVMQGPNTNRDNALYVNTYSLGGTLLNQYALPHNPDYTLITYRPYVTPSGATLLLGSYSLRTDLLEQGIYALKINEGEQEFLRFYDFGYFRNFFEYMKTRQKEKLKERVAKRKAADKNLLLRYNLLVHQLYETDDWLIISGESVDVQANRSVQPTRMVGGIRNPGDPAAMFPGNDPSMRRYIQRFPGAYATDRGYLPAALAQDAPVMSGGRSVIPTDFRYEHAFACGFDKEGNLSWDNIITYNETEDALPVELSKAYATTDSVYFITPDKDEIIYKASPLLSYTDSSSTTPVEQLTENDELKIGNYSHGGVLNWYKGSFLFSGIRKYSDDATEDGYKRYFFLSKLTFKQ